MKTSDAISKKLSWPYPSDHRLLHSPSLVAVGLSVGYETWPPIGWHHPIVIGWSEDRLGLPSAPLLTWPVGIPTIFQTPVTAHLHCPNGRPAVRAVQGNCERVYSSHSQIACRAFPWGGYPHSLIKPRKCQLTIIETILLARDYKIQQSNDTESHFCTLHDQGPTHW